MELVLHHRSETLSQPHAARQLPLCKVLITMALTSVACYNASGSVARPAPSWQGTGVPLWGAPGGNPLDHAAPRVAGGAEPEGPPHHGASVRVRRGVAGLGMESLPPRAPEEPQRGLDEPEETTEDGAQGKGDGRGPPGGPVSLGKRWQCQPRGRCRQNRKVVQDPVLALPALLNGPGVSPHCPDCTVSSEGTPAFPGAGTKALSLLP